jgi:hypothetical protein
LYYYTAWTLTEVVHNASGFGFNGFDEKGLAKWDLANNVNIEAIEMSSTMKDIVDNWNIQTRKWMRAVGYERLPRCKTVGVFFLSAVIFNLIFYKREIRVIQQFHLFITGLVKRRFFEISQILQS